MDILSTRNTINRLNFIILFVSTLLIGWIAEKTFFLNTYDALLLYKNSNFDNPLFATPIPTISMLYRYFATDDIYIIPNDNFFILQSIIPFCAWLIMWQLVIVRLNDIQWSNWYSCLIMMPPLLIPALVNLVEIHFLLGYSVLLISLLPLVGLVVISVKKGNSITLDTSSIIQKKDFGVMHNNQTSISRGKGYPQLKLEYASIKLMAIHKILLAVVILSVGFIITAKLAADKTTWTRVYHHPPSVEGGNHMFDLSRTWLYWICFILTQGVFQLWLWTAQTITIPKLKIQSDA